MQVVRLNPAPTTWREVLEEFILRKQAEGASKRTLDDYREHVTPFFAEHPTCCASFTCGPSSSTALRKAT
ncbi:hypothetical protein TAMC210_07540 [Thermanaeromonas sp. C210]|nr:hypothetical protein TAMC210_07540 [Thermanaeromonas sp. C210]